MARLFGGFDTAFFQAYDEAWPLDPGFDDTRCALYQLYYLLVHVNLFGGSYVGGVNAVLRRFG
jgi:fructosamine-3-kinase